MVCCTPRVASYASQAHPSEVIALYAYADKMVSACEDKMLRVRPVPCVCVTLLRKTSGKWTYVHTYLPAPGPCCAVQWDTVAYERNRPCRGMAVGHVTSFEGLCRFGLGPCRARAGPPVRCTRCLLGYSIPPLVLGAPWGAQRTDLRSCVLGLQVWELATTSGDWQCEQKMLAGPTTLSAVALLNHHTLFSGRGSAVALRHVAPVVLCPMGSPHG